MVLWEITYTILLRNGRYMHTSARITATDIQAAIAYFASQQLVEFNITKVEQVA